MTVIDKVVPNIVGVDIGCEISVTRIAEHDIDFKRLDEICHIIPSGMDTWDNAQMKLDIDKLLCYRELSHSDRIKKSLGTLGGGNHFIELDRDNNGDYYLLMHSGSRNLGKQVAEYYQRLAIDLHKGKDVYYEKRTQLIKEYKKH